MINRDGLGLDLQNHFFAEDVADKAFIESRESVESEAVRQFSRAHPEKSSRLTFDQGVDLFGNASDIHIDCDERDIQIILKNTIGTVERAVGLRVEDPVSAAKIIRPSSRAGFQEDALKIREPKFLLARGEGRFSDIPEKSVLVFYYRDRDAPEGLQNALGKRRHCGILIQIDMIDLRNLF